MKDEVNSLRRENDDLRAENDDAGHALELKKRELFLNTANENDEASLLAKLKVRPRFYFCKNFAFRTDRGKVVLISIIRRRVIISRESMKQLLTPRTSSRVF